jgi:ATP-dependent Lhr-like helicase
MKPQDIEKQIVNYIEKIGWKEPTSIQKKSIPVITRRKHCLLVAPTGSGKTEAAVIPILAQLAHFKQEKKGIRALYITPLKALNRDIFGRVIKYTEDAKLTAGIRHGDTSQYTRQQMVKKPPDLLITTPETLAIILTSRRMRENLRTLEWVVIDELHELIGNERGTHLTVSLERVELLAKKNIVRVGLSATLGNVNEAGKFLAGNGRRTAVLVDQSVRRYDIDLNYVKGSLLHVSDYVSNYIKENVGKSKSTILFTNTRDEAEYLGALLKAKTPDIPVEVHHGSLSRETREDAESKLRNGEAGVVVSTSSLELGLDIGQVDLVVQSGSSRQSVKLIQRIGRSKHRVGESASGLVVTNKIDDELEARALINRIYTGSLEKSIIHELALDVLAHHLVGIVMEYGRLSINEAITILGKAYPFRDISSEDVDLCFEILYKQKILWYDGEEARGRGLGTYEYYYHNISTIPDIQQLTVIDRVSDKKVGRLDQVFIGEYGEPGKPFVLKGSTWKIISIDEDKAEVNVEPTFEDLSTIPYWVGELIPVELETATEVGKLRRRIGKDFETGVSEEQKKRIQKSKDILGHIPDEKTITVEKRIGSSILVIHTCLGSKINQTLAIMLSTIISSKTGYLIETNTDPYRILLTSQGALSIKNVIDFFHQQYDVANILSVSVVGTHPLNWKTWCIAKKFGVVVKKAQYDKRAARLIQDRYRKTALYREVLRELFIEKYDIKRTNEVLHEIQNNKRRIIEKEVKKLSPLAQPILQHTSAFAALPLSIEKTVLDLIKERLENKRHRLVCMSCGKWESVVKTKDVKDPISCPICRSRLIGGTYSTDNDLIHIIRKKKAKITSDENKKFKRAWKTSSLIQSFGLKAIITLSGFGVGADAAARILRRYSKGDEFYKDIYRAEKTYISTRGFWDD